VTDRASGSVARFRYSWIAQPLPSGSLKYMNVAPSCGANCTGSLTSSPRAVSSSYAAFASCDAQLHAVVRPRLRGTGGYLQPVHEGDGTPGPRRRQLHDPHALHHLAVEIDMEADLVPVELLGPVHVGDGQQDHFEGHVHGDSFVAGTVVRGWNTSSCHSNRHRVWLNGSPLPKPKTVRGATAKTTRARNRAGRPRPARRSARSCRTWPPTPPAPALLSVSPVRLGPIRP
jgi:hypothetical protein